MREYLLSSINELTKALGMISRAQGFIEEDDPEFQNEENEFIQETLGQAIALIKEAIRVTEKQLI